MLRRSVLLIAAGCMALGVAGRELAGAASLPSRELGGLTVVASQLLGGARALPLLALWQRAWAAQDRGDWFEQLALFDVIDALAPSNPEVVHSQVLLEAGTLAVSLPQRSDGAAWVERGIHRAERAIARMPESAKPLEAIWQAGFGPAGRRFPVEYALAAATAIQDQDLARSARRHLEAMNEDPAATGFLERVGLVPGYFESTGPDGGYLALPEDSQRMLVECDLLRWQAMMLVASRMTQRSQDRNSTQLLQFVSTLRRVSQFSVDAEDKATAVAAAKNALQREIARLEAIGAAGEAENLAEVFEVWFGEWMGHGNGPVSAD